MNIGDRFQILAQPFDDYPPVGSEGVLIQVGSETYPFVIKSEMPQKFRHTFAYVADELQPLMAAPNDWDDYLELV